MSSIAFLTIVIAIAAVLGILLGMIKYRGIGLGIGGVLFSGIIVGHFAHQYFGLDVRSAEGLTVAGNILHYVQEFGLILFVYAIGIQVGPSFFSSLRGMGAKLISWAFLIILLNCIIAMCLYFTGIVDVSAMIGMYSGGITNTPALGAGTTMINDMAKAFADQGLNPAELGFDANVVPSAYAMAYPFGVCSLLIVMIMIRVIFGVDIEKAGDADSAAKSAGKPAVICKNVVVGKAFAGKTIAASPGVTEGLVVCSRLKHEDNLMVPDADYVLCEGDKVHIVGLPDHVAEAIRPIGSFCRDALTTHGTAISVRHIIVTNNHMMGKTLGALDLDHHYHIVISRVFRAGVQFMPTPELKLQFGDELNVIGKLEDIKAAGAVIGNSSTTMNKVSMLPIFIGLFLGILLGQVPIAIPGVPAPLKLGLAGGPLIMAILLSRFGDTLTHNALHWRLPVPALAAFREIGITLFLCIVGICAGANGFWETLTAGPGFKWMCWATLISFIPLLIVGFLAFKLSKINYLVLSGMMAGSYTDPPALAFANGMYKDAEASSIGYATVYPVVMFLRILSPQVMVVIAAAFI